MLTLVVLRWAAEKFMETSSVSAEQDTVETGVRGEY